MGNLKKYMIALLLIIVFSVSFLVFLNSDIYTTSLVLKAKCDNDFLIRLSNVNCETNNIDIGNITKNKNSVQIGVAIDFEKKDIVYSENCIFKDNKFSCIFNSEREIQPGKYNLYLKYNNWGREHFNKLDTSLTFIFPLRRGINITKWFRYAPQKTKVHYNEYVIQKDIEQIKSLGYNHIRLPIEVTDFYNDPAMFEYLKNAVELITKNGLGVVVDAHSQSLNNKIEGSQAEKDKYMNFWGQLASNYKDSNFSNIMFELYNEPQFSEDKKGWSDFQIKLYTKVRSILPNHTLILTGNQGSHLYSLKEIDLPDDPNLVYDLHFYTDLSLTHQGASWSKEYFSKIKGLEYPYNKLNCKEVLDKLTDPKAKEKVQKYCKDQFNSKKIDDSFAGSVDLLLKDKKKIWIGEFGLNSCISGLNENSQNLIKNSKVKYLSDIHKAMDKRNLPSALWGFDDCFGLNAKKVNGKFEFDNDLIKRP
jgi:endoglucanase